MTVAPSPHRTTEFLGPMVGQRCGSTEHRYEAVEWDRIPLDDNR